MGLMDKLFGTDRPTSTDQKALERYRYLLRTAPPDAIEQAHAEAFAQLTPSQREQVLQSLSEELPPAERPRDTDPQALARSATRAELRHPGVVERSLSRGPSMGGMFASTLLGSVVGTFVGSAIATQIMGGDNDPGAVADSDADTGGDSMDDDAGGDLGDFGDV